MPWQDQRAGQTEASLAGAVGTYREWPASGPLAPDLACLWMHALPESISPPLRIVPDGCIDIVWTGTALQVAGPDTQPVIESFAAGTLIVGVRFRPGAAPPWLGVPASAIVNDRVPLQEFWGSGAQRLADRLHDVREPRRVAELMRLALGARSPRTSLLDPATRALAAALARNDSAGPRIATLTAGLGLSERTLRRRCESAFGYGPKTLQRILRFQQFLALLRRSPTPGLAELAIATGFADQAHLTREVRRLGGSTPASFLSRLAA